MNIRILLALVLCGVGRLSAEMLLVQDGQAPVPIVVFAEAPPLTRQAADELADYIEKVSGARPEVLDGLPDPIPEHAIWVGYQPKLVELFPDIDFDFQHPEEILIACDGRNLAILGRDIWDPENLMIQRPHGKLMGVQMEYGTANAVATFMRDWLDVRWLWPGALGEDIVERQTIVFQPFEYRYHPQIRFRSGLFSYMRRQHNSGRAGPGSGGAWWRLQRGAMGSFEMNAAGHGFGSWWGRYHESHPEYFALQPDGTRQPPGDPGNAKICHSNPAVWQQWLDNVAEQI
ncbi:MAG: DUF4838 domain-containing protein, partial [Kiritimatiellia bacterium]